MRWFFLAAIALSNLIGISGQAQICDPSSIVDVAESPCSIQPCEPCPCEPCPCSIQPCEPCPCEPCPCSIQPCEPCPCFSLRGFYVGAFAGWVSQDKVWVDRDSWMTNFSQNFALGSTSTTNNHVNGGIEGGYNALCGSALLGLESDIGWTRLHDRKFYTPIATATTLLTISDNCTYLATIRARAGLMARRLLLYGTIGAGFAHFRHTWRMDLTPLGISEEFRVNTVRAGAVFGGGVEVAFTRLLSIKGEFLYFKFPEQRVVEFSTVIARQVTFDLQNAVWLLRLGLNFNLSNLCFR